MFGARRAEQVARIPQAEIDRLKREVSIEKLAKARRIELKRSGESLVGLCPFHEEESPSFRLDPKRNVFNCFGCGAKGSVIDFVMLLEGVSFRHAVELLLADYPSLPAASDERVLAPKLPELVDPEASDDQLRTEVALYYHEVLKRSPEAIGYLEQRGLDQAAVVDRFKLGFSNRTLGYRIPHRGLKDGKAIRGRLQELGIMKATGHELMRGSLTVPIINGSGKVVQIYGRKISDKQLKGTPKHLYLRGPRRGVWNLAALAESKEIILCEALIDALTFVSAGFSNVTSAYGKNGFTEEHLQAFKSYGTERVLIAYDRDKESEPVAEALAGRLGAEGISCFRVKLPHGMDANEYALKVTPPAQSLAVLLRSASYLSGPLKTLAVVPAPAPEAGKPAEGAEKPVAPAEPGPEESMNQGVVKEAEPALPLTAGSEPGEAVKTKEIPASPAPPAARTQSPPATGRRKPAAKTASRKKPRARPQPSPAPEGSAQASDRPAPASPVPPSLACDVPAEVREHEIEINLNGRRYRVRGMARNMSLEQLRINLMVTAGERFHVDNLNLYSARQRGIFLKQASEELQVKQEALKRDVGKVLLKLEQLQEEQIRKTLEAKDAPVVLNDTERTEALELLKDPQLLQRIASDLETSGLVGEHVNKLVCYLAAVSRKLDKPLAVVVQSSSAAGKSALMEAVLSFTPEEERVQYSAMTGQSLFYMGETDLKHKVLAIAEEEGAERASYSLKLLQSEGELTIASTGKEPSTGRLTTHEYHVEGPAAIMLTTTAIDMDEELQNRCIVLAVDESREQTMAIHQRQREDRTFAGLERRLSRAGMRKRHQNAQRLLRPVYVVNPYSPELTFAVNTTRTRRDHLKYLILIETIALLHQHQREIRSGVLLGRRVDYVEVTLADIEAANQLASEALGRTLDELPPQTRRLLFLVEELVKEACRRQQMECRHYRLTRRQIREHTGWSLTQLRVHLERLVDMEYLIVHRGGRGSQFVYELMYDGEGKDGRPFVLGLIDVEKLRRRQQNGKYDANLAGSDRNLAGQQDNLAGSKRGQNGGVAGGWRGEPSSEEKGNKSDIRQEPPKNAHQGTQQKPVIVAVGSSYVASSEEPKAEQRDEQREASEDNQPARKRSENDR